MRKVGDALSSVGKSADGSKIFVKVGTVFQHADELVLKLMVMPFPKQQSDGTSAVWLKLDMAQERVPGQEG